MNEPACRAYRAAILPTFLHSRPNPKFNPKTKPNTNPIAADATFTELQESSVTQIVCARHFVQKLVQVQHTNSSTANRISGVWALMSTAVRSIVVCPTYRMAYIHHITTLMAHMPGGVYYFQGCASFTDVLD